MICLKSLDRNFSSAFLCNNLLTSKYNTFTPNEEVKRSCFFRITKDFSQLVKNRLDLNKFQKKFPSSFLHEPKARQVPLLKLKKNFKPSRWIREWDR